MAIDWEGYDKHLHSILTGEDEEEYDNEGEKEMKEDVSRYENNKDGTGAKVLEGINDTVDTIKTINRHIRDNISGFSNPELISMINLVSSELRAQEKMLKRINYVM